MANGGLANMRSIIMIGAAPAREKRNVKNMDREREPYAPPVKVVNRITSYTIVMHIAPIKAIFFKVFI